MPNQPVVYQLDTHDRHNRDEQQQEQVTNFLRAHGIDPLRFMVGTSLYVRRHEDGTLWLHTWQALEGHPLCPHCEGCIKSEPVVVPLVEQPPLMDEAFVSPDWLGGLDRTAVREHARHTKATEVGTDG